MSDTIYSVCLRPLGPYFFGGENSFGEGAEANYHVRSNQLPQQTTLLGLMRHHLLLTNGLIGVDDRINDRNRAAVIIGPASFPSGNYGAISAISPVFLERKKDGTVSHWHPKGLANGLIPKREVGSSLMNGKVRREILTLSGYDPKVERHQIWHSPNHAPMLAEHLFIESSQVGIKKQQDEEAFYKKVSFEFENVSGADWAFKFYVRANPEVVAKWESGIILAGGERSAFKVEINKVSGNLIQESGWQFPFSSPILPEGDAIQVTLNSDGLVTKVPDHHVAVGETTLFRYLGSSVQNTGRYYNVSKVNTLSDALTKSRLTELSKAGSEFFFLDISDAASFIADLQLNSEYIKIGYNYYSVQATI